MNVHESLKDLNKLLDNNANFVNENLDYANKMLDQIPQDKRDEMRSHMTDIRGAMKSMDSSKLMETINKLKNDAR